MFLLSLPIGPFFKLPPVAFTIKRIILLSPRLLNLFLLFSSITCIPADLVLIPVLKTDKSEHLNIVNLVTTRGHASGGMGPFPGWICVPAGLA